MFKGKPLSAITNQLSGFSFTIFTEVWVKIHGKFYNTIESSREMLLSWCYTKNWNNYLGIRWKKPAIEKDELHIPKMFT